MFIAMWLPPNLRDRINDFVQDIRGRPEFKASLRWVRPDGMHLTLQFLGEVPRPTVSRIENELGRIEFSPFPVQVRGVGFFPREEAPRVFWAGVTSEDFCELAVRVHRQMAALGFQPPAHPLKPHLTLARVKGRFRFDRTLMDVARGFQEYDFGSATLDRMVLVESHLSPGGARYSEVAGFTFRDQA
jgi:2'-5' RNA ligase